jgi:tetratricopeptide (TPR) repeat protein
MRATPSLGAVLAAALLALTVAGSGCSTHAERREQHLSRAAAFEAEGKLREALIELRSALKLDPQSAEINFRLAEVLEQGGQLTDAIFFFGEARRLDPEFSEAALREATLLVFDDLDRMEELVEGVLSREPDNDHAHVVRSRLELARNDVDAALQSALTAVELAPEKPWTHQQLGKVHQARIQIAQLEEGGTPSEELYRAAAESFRRAAEHASQELRWREELEVAKVLAAWPGKEEEATEAFRSVLESAEKATQAGALATALQEAAGFAERRGDDELTRWVLERHLEVAPSALPSWTRLAILEERASGGGIAVMDRMIEALDGSPDAHVRYVQFLLSTQRKEEAFAYLEKVAASHADRPEVLASQSNFLLGLGYAEKAGEVVASLERRHPDHPSTARARAQMALAEDRVEEAVEALRAALDRGGESAEMQRLLARAEARLGNLHAALEAITRSLELSRGEPEFPEQSHRLKVHLAARVGDCAAAMQSLMALRRTERSLGVLERVHMAHCMYETGRRELGRRLLVDLLALPNPPMRAVDEFARREGRSDPERLRRALQRAAAARPDDPRVVVHLARMDLREGRPEEALDRLNAVVAQGGPVSPELVLERARVLAAQGEIELAQRDALQAFEVRPDLEAAATLLVQLYRAQGRVAEVIASFEQARDAGVLGAPARVLLARLYLTEGQREKAKASLESALAERSDLPGAKNDLAFLLASEGGDLDRALRLAQEAVQAMSERPEAADTLGFVYLQRNLVEPALQQFRYAIELAERQDSLRAVYPYHLGLALSRLGLDAAAADAFRRALSIDADFQEAAAELHRLQESADLQEGGAQAS